VRICDLTEGDLVLSDELIAYPIQAVTRCLVLQHHVCRIASRWPDHRYFSKSSVLDGTLAGDIQTGSCWKVFVL